MKLNPDRILAVLEVYTLSELLEAANLEDEDVLLILLELGYLDSIDLPEPL